MSATMHAIRVRNAQLKKAELRARRDAQAASIYPHARTFVLTEASPLGDEAGGLATLDGLPTTLTLVTPDHMDHSQDQLFVGPHPVAENAASFDTDFEELTFTGHDGTCAMRGQLRLTRSRTRAFGVIEIAGQTYSVQYEVKPQRYVMRIGKGAAYLAGTSQMPLLKWDTESDRWKNATWSETDEVSFTYGVDGQEVLDGEKMLTFVASFEDLATAKSWKPVDGFYSGLINSRQVLQFGVMSGVTPPPSGRDGGTLFPFQLRVALSEFADRFEGAMLTDRPDLQGTVYGVQGRWVGGGVAGLYHLAVEDGNGGSLVSVHDGRLFIGADAVDSTIVGDTLHYTGLTDEAAAATGLPTDGHITFSPDGASVLETSGGHGGGRVTPTQAAALAAKASTEAHGLALPGDDAVAAAADGTHGLAELLTMSQYVKSDDGNFYDLFQQQSMEDFYAILQEYMDPDIRKQFFNPNPPPLDPGLRSIADTPGKDGEDPKAWYRQLSTAYAVGSLSKWSTDPGAPLLNGKRADSWLSNQTGISPVMLRQGPLMYARRYQAKHTVLDWYLQDQQANAATYEPVIRSKADAWLKEMEANATGTPEELAKLRKQITDLRDAAIVNKQYWAFAVYTYATTPAYLNMLQTILASGDEIDGSEFTQRVQRTSALLNVLDVSSFFTSQYAYVLQLFQVASVLPQLIDYTGDITKFSFVVRQIVDKFIAQYINSEDPKMREAAEALKKHSTETLVEQILQVMRQSNAALSGLFSWTTLAATFESTIAKVFGALPKVVATTIFLGAASLLITFFVTGKVDWNDIPPLDQAVIIGNAAGIVALLVKEIVVRGVALSEVWASSNGLWKNLGMFFSPSLMTKAEQSMAAGFKGWLIQSVSGIEETMDAMAMRMFFAEAAEAAALEAELARMTTIHKIFGRNLSEFLATRLGAALAAVGIIMSAFLLANSHEPLDIAANSLFLFASVMEFIATAGVWACQAFGLAAIGGVAVGTIFAVVSVIGVIALVAGAILLAVLMFRPQESPLEKWAREKAGTYYMKYKTDIDYFQQYQPLGQKQRCGVSLAPGGKTSNCLFVADDGSLSQRPFDGTGHTALYLRTDEQGRAQLGAPVQDKDGNRTFLVLGLDQEGKLVAAKPTGDATADAAALWRAEIQSEGTKEKDKEGNSFLQSAPFLFYNDAWFTKTGKKRYIVADGATGWKADDGASTSITVAMVSTKPGMLTMADVAWMTYEHDKSASPVLGIPGSAPRKWALSPALPKGLLFLNDTGAVVMELGVDVPPAPEATYTLSVDNEVGRLDTSFKLKISPAGA
ncbi:MAG: hypothetical protein IPJ61_13415 [Tessaracoccus sp.]|uniref:hypothetical protein n=1 Tax=Tessaracoccus sp. TaxID=1971211 RepID=UPI001EB8671E|nr:hypothetical protein [Tessaracoccus sp.]MBK7822029.1 hypothetical protein [Tessaracoccus sp.]